MDPKHAALRTYLLAALAGCGSPEDWPACGNEAELTAETYEGFGTLEDPDFYVCGPLPEDGSACLDHTEIEANTFFEENVGPTGDNGQYYMLDADCGPEPTREDACCYVIELDGYVSAGRPFVVHGRARVAMVRAGAAGLTGDALPIEVAARLAHYWSAAALAEHASVASFARFTLELLALGAPPELLADAARAQGDEVVHAREAFALASRFAGRAIAAGPLDIGGALVPPAAVAMAEALAREGCVGETLAAALAAAQHDAARDAEVRRALARVARDEARHAALAWRAARWLGEAFPETRAPFAAALADAVGALGAAPEAGAAGSPNAVNHPALRAHGVLAGADVHAVLRAVAAEVIGPVGASLAA